MQIMKYLLFFWLDVNFNVVYGVLSMIVVDSEDGVATETSGNLNLDTDFLLGQDLEFGDPDHDNKLLGLEKFSGL